MKFEAQLELAPRTTLGVGGPAAHYVRVESETELHAAYDQARALGLDVRVLGGGSNIVVADAGFPGLVIELSLRGMRMTESGNVTEVSAAAGEPWDDFVAAMVAEGLQGLECLSGIPGRVGATPIQNVGAYGQDVSETISRVVTFDTVTRRTVVFDNEACHFAYRDSVFKSKSPGRFIVTEVSFRLARNAPPAVRYAELERAFKSTRCTAPSLADARQMVLSLRRKKSMLLDPSDPNTRSCGSFFVNPVLTPAEHADFAGRAQAEGNVPQFPQADGRTKLSAGWLIEHAGFPRGTRRGNVGLSTEHALALVAHPGARAMDIADLARRVQSAVHERFGVRLQPEPVFWGFSLDD